jgi:hypothetical protein
VPPPPPPENTHTHTRQQVELPKLSLDKFSDAYFKAAEDKAAKKAKKQGEDEFFKKGAPSVCWWPCAVRALLCAAARAPQGQHSTSTWLAVSLCARAWATTRPRRRPPR